ncbi:DUF4381 domain-containing protein [Pseudidiomarina homiensis]|uniref:DUF4381 domain-containing protein n=1 Tax=Pseudidiomarina homiensis TaxID=364198 RepID=UPI00215B6081|nr:DUF4381 domain-containing protein [Pseudidiomarina homiensis]
MTNPALSELNPIIAAPAASWWPLAPGWYVVAITAVSLTLLLTLTIVRAVRRRRIRRAALRQLQPGLALNELNLRIKQACMGYYPRKHIAQLSGRQWRDFLLQQLSERNAARYYDLLVEVEQASYRPFAEQAELQQRYYEFTKAWLKLALPPSKAQRRRIHD